MYPRVVIAVWSEEQITEIIRKSAQPTPSIENRLQDQLRFWRGAAHFLAQHRRVAVRKHRACHMGAMSIRIVSTIGASKRIKPQNSACKSRMRIRR